MKLDLDELERVARAATPGALVAIQKSIAFSETFRPETVLALIARLREAERLLDYAADRLSADFLTREEHTVADELRTYLESAK